MRVYLLVLLSLAAFPAQAQADQTDQAVQAKTKLCESANFRFAGWQPPSIDSLDLRSFEKSGDSLIDQVQFNAQRSPAGHSYLGKKYLARLFGYDGNFKDETMSDWIARESYQRQGGNTLRAVWEKWYYEHPKKLQIPLYPHNPKLGPEDPRRLFHSQAEIYEYSQCVLQDVMKAKCEQRLGFKLDWNLHQVEVHKRADGDFYCAASWINDNKAYAAKMRQKSEAVSAAQEFRASRDGKVTSAESGGSSNQNRGFVPGAARAGAN